MAKRRKHKLYDSFYGDIPDDIDGRLKYLFKGARSLDKLKSTVEVLIEDSKKIKKKKISFIWYTEPHPSSRPRANTSSGYVRMYVPYAADTKIAFQKFWKENFPNFKPIGTPMIFNLKAYVKTPSSFSRSEKILAELGIIKPWGRIMDIDNFFKAATDCTIGTLIEDDSLIHDMHTEKFYSIKPRIEYEVIYYTRFPRNIKAMNDQNIKNVRSDMKAKGGK